MAEGLVLLFAYNSILAPLRGIYPLYSLLSNLRGVPDSESRQRLGAVETPGDDLPEGSPGGTEAPGSAPRALWLQASSVGEVAVATVLVGALRRARPSLSVYVTTTTRTGQTLARRLAGPRTRVGYFPLDFRGAVRRTLSSLRPSALILIETEIWPNLLAAAGSRGIPVLIVNGRLSDRAFRRYRLIAPLLSRVLRHVRFVGAQSALDRDRFVGLGLPAERIRVTGNIKFAAVTSSSSPSPWLRELGLGSDDQVWIGGSTAEGEEEALLDAFDGLPAPRTGGRVLVIAPRRPERFDSVARMLDERGLPWRRRSEAAPGGQTGHAGVIAAPGRGTGHTGVIAAPGDPDGRVPTRHRGDRDPAETGRAGVIAAPGSAAWQTAKARVILLDSLGELFSLYGHAAVAFVGGTLASVGGHNIIEPAAWGVAPIFGPNVQNFRDAAARLLEAGGAFQVRDASELSDLFARMASDPSLGREAGEKARRVVEENAGAVEETVREILAHLPEGEGSAA